MANILGFIGIGISGVSLLFAILAIALNYWETKETGNSEIRIGLWEICVEIRVESGGTTDCTSIDSDSVSDDDLKKIRAVRATAMLGLILIVAAVVSGILVMFVMKSTKILYFVAGGLDIAAGLFLMIAMAVYVDKIATEDFDYHAAFALDILAWIAAWAAGGIFVGAKMMDKE